jgi:hypothetical protein
MMTATGFWLVQRYMQALQCYLTLMLAMRNAVQSMRDAEQPVFLFSQLILGLDNATVGLLNDSYLIHKRCYWLKHAT